METTQTLDTAVVTTPDLQAMYSFAAEQLVHQQRAGDDVAEMLVQKGMDPDAAVTLVDSLQQQIIDAKRSRAQKDMLWGGLWFFGGLIVTFVTYSNASGGGSYMVAWGAILFGGIQFFRGVINSQS